MIEPEPIDWRAAIALLANADTRAVFAAAAAGPVPTGSAHGRALDRLQAAGLLEPGADGRPVVAEARLRATLKQAAPPRASGVERFLTHEGRIVDYPSRAADRLDLLRLVVNRTLTAEEDLSERELGERLGRFTSDVATLRRYLVDARLLDRSPDGRSYRRAVPDEISAAGSS